MTRCFYGTGYFCHDKGCPWLGRVKRMGKAAVRDSCLNPAVTDEQRGQNYDGWIV